MEMMDRLAIEAAEAFVKVGYPLDVEALLIVELDGVGAECDHLIDEVTRIAEANGSTTLSASRDEAERRAFWAGRKAAFPAVGRSEEHTSELQSLMRISYAVFCLKKKHKNMIRTKNKLISRQIQT